MRESAGVGGDTRPEVTCGLLVGAVLEESGEQQIAFAQHFEALLVVLAVFAAGRIATLLASTRIEAISRKALASSMFFVKSSPRTYVRNSSVIEERETSVSSSLLLAIMPSKASNGPE